MTEPAQPDVREERPGVRLLTRGGLGFAAVLIPGLRFGWPGLAAALVAGGVLAATVLVQRRAVARARRGLSRTRIALEAGAVTGLLVAAGTAQIAVLLAAPGAGPDAQVSSLSRLLGRHSVEELLAQAAALISAGIVLGGAVGAATLADPRLPPDGEGRPPSPVVWLVEWLVAATAILVAPCALLLEGPEPVRPLLVLAGAAIAPTLATLLVVLPLGLLENVLHELVLAASDRRGQR